SPSERPVLHHQAAVHHERNCRRLRAPPGRLVHHAHLQPDQPGGGLQADRFLHDRAHELAASKHIDYVERVIDRRRRQRRVAPPTTRPERRPTVRASVDGTLGVATYATPARAALYASSADIRPVTSSPRPTIGVRAMTAAPITLSTALCRPMSSAWNNNRSLSVSAAAWMPPVSL